MLDFGQLLESAVDKSMDIRVRTVNCAQNLRALPACLICIPQLWTGKCLLDLIIGSQNSTDPLTSFII